MSGASAGRNASIKSYKLIINGVTYNSSSATSDVISKSGTVTVTAQITDSRGRTSTVVTKNITFTAYKPPSITTFKAARQSTSTTIKVDWAVSYLDIAGNSCTTKIETKQSTASSWSVFQANTTSTSGSKDLTDVSDLVTQQFRLTSTDSFGNSASRIISVGTAKVAFSIGKNEGIGAGKVWEEGALDIGGNAGIKQPDGTYTTIKRGGDVAIGIGSPTLNDTTGANIQIYHDGRIRTKASYLIDADGRIGHPMASISSGDSASFTVPFGCVVLIWMNQGGAHTHRKGLWVVFASNDHPSDYSEVHKIAGPADITITTALVSNGVRITVKNNDNPGSSNPWGYMMLAGYLS